MVSLAHPPPSTQSEPSAQSELSAQPEQSTPPDPSVPKPSEHSDPPIFIGVMGLTGTGKSAFIRTLTGDEEIKVGHGLTSCKKNTNHQLALIFRITWPHTGTKKIQSSQMMVGNHRVFLIDTPGFDDTYISDIDLLTSIGDWLKTSDDEKCHLSGLIYLHRISDDRVGGVARRSLTMMRNLLGDDNLQNLVLVTNRWEEVRNTW